MNGAPTSTSGGRRGPVLDVLNELLPEGRNDEVLAVVEIAPFSSDAAGQRGISQTSL